MKTRPFTSGKARLATLRGGRTQRVRSVALAPAVGRDLAVGTGGDLAWAIRKARFHNVEIVVAEEIGRESVQYVSAIYKYYSMYRLISEQEQGQ